MSITVCDDIRGDFIVKGVYLNERKAGVCMNLGIVFIKRDDPAELADTLTELAQGDITVDHRRLFEKFSDEKTRRNLKRNARFYPRAARR